MSNDIRKHPRPQQAWGVYNWGRLSAIARTRREAIAMVQERCGQSWTEAKKYMEVHKVIVSKKETP